MASPDAGQSLVEHSFSVPEAQLPKTRKKMTISRKAQLRHQNLLNNRRRSVSVPEGPLLTVDIDRETLPNLLPFYREDPEYWEETTDLESERWNSKVVWDLQNRSSGDGEESIDESFSEFSASLKNSQTEEERAIAGGCICGKVKKEKGGMPPEVVSDKLLVADSTDLTKASISAEAVLEHKKESPETANGHPVLTLKHSKSCSDVLKAASAEDLDQTGLGKEIRHSDSVEAPDVNRRYLLGPGGSALIGKEELLAVLPDETARIFIGTWNVAGQRPKEEKDLKRWLSAGITDVDIYAVGIQEGPSFDPNFWKEWEDIVQGMLGPRFLRYYMVRLGVQMLIIFVRKCLVWFLTDGVKSHSRFEDCRKIVQALHFPKYPVKHRKNAIRSYDRIFWFGDLNFKIEDHRSAVEALVNSIFTGGKSANDPSGLLVKDQLKTEMKSGKIFHGFSEGLITFPPTYKYDLGTSNLDTSVKNRVPAYTDRILFRNNEGPKNSIQVLVYNSVHEINLSDHKPVYAVFKVHITPGASRLDPVAHRMLNKAKQKAAMEQRKKPKTESSICLLM